MGSAFSQLHIKAQTERNVLFSLSQKPYQKLISYKPVAVPQKCCPIYNCFWDNSKIFHKKRGLQNEVFCASI